LTRLHGLGGGVALGLVGWAAAVHAAEPLSRVLACRTLTEADARLACFDRETAHLDEKTPSTGALAPVPPPPALNPTQQFGLPERAVAKQEVAAGVRSADAERVQAHIVNVGQTVNGRAILTLDNDQVWRQLAADIDLMAKPGDAVTISRGVFGSYWLQMQLGRGTKVTRVR